MQDSRRAVDESVVAAALLPLVVLLTLILLGVVQGREDQQRFAALRWQGWQLAGGLLVLILFAAHVEKLIALLIALLFAVVLLVQKRLAHRHVDDWL
ncbi:MAG: hypothetical protein E6G60_20650 [Actinobacteria bacterium]|nr:MAG: hypothetical protein E6G60_20650 [Actinomycetota bacterium]